MRSTNAEIFPDEQFLHNVVGNNIFDEFSSGGLSSIRTVLSVDRTSRIRLENYDPKIIFLHLYSKFMDSN